MANYSETGTPDCILDFFQTYHKRTQNMEVSEQLRNRSSNIYRGLLIKPDSVSSNKHDPVS